MAKTLHMETTQVSASRTAGEIIQELVSSGARQIATDYNERQQITGLRWVFQVNGQPALFAMPARVEPIYKILRSRRKGFQGGAAELALREQAERVAWRQLLRWVQAQIALIQTGMVEPGEVFAPYLIDHGTGKTLWLQITESRFKALPPAGGAA